MAKNRNMSACIAYIWNSKFEIQISITYIFNGIRCRKHQFNKLYGINETSNSPRVFDNNDRFVATLSAPKSAWLWIVCYRTRIINTTVVKRFTLFRLIMVEWRMVVAIRIGYRFGLFRSEINEKSWSWTAKIRTTDSWFYVFSRKLIP